MTMNYIKSCDQFILILSDGSMDRCKKAEDPVAIEINLAIDSQCNIIPLVINADSFTFPHCLSYLQKIQQTKFRTPTDELDFSIQKLIDRLKSEKMTIEDKDRIRKEKFRLEKNQDCTTEKGNTPKEQDSKNDLSTTLSQTTTDLHGPLKNTHNGHEFVDLGLPSGLKWATCNVGASTPTECGWKLAWGETMPKRNYTREYKWGNESYGGIHVCKYNDSTGEYGRVDGRKKLESSDDAATTNWGDGWRTPTLDDMKELMASCDWVWQNDYNGSGIAGQLGTSKKNGNTIFLPAAEYWSSSLAHPVTYASYLSICKGFKWINDFRYMGRTVRAVLDMR